MKKLVIALMVLATFTSCGKKNSVNTATPVAAAPVAATSTLTTSASGAIEAELASKISNNSFGTGTIYVSGYPETFSQLVTNFPNLTYKYGTMDITNNSSNSTHCATISKIPILCASWNASSSFSSITFTDKRTVVHSSVTDGDKKQALIDLLNKRSVVYRDQFYAGVYYIILADSSIYTIDTSRPLQANPVTSQKSSNKREVLYGWSSSN